MLKKSLIIFFSAFCAIILTSSMCFATNVMEDTRDTLDNIGNGMNEAVTDIKDDVKTGAEEVGNAVHDGATDVKDKTMDMTSDDEYTATQTSATSATTTNMSFVWIILAIAAIAIIALVWYYTTQTENSSRDSH